MVNLYLHYDILTFLIFFYFPVNIEIFDFNNQIYHLKYHFQ
jgi:hypothetical protein